VSSNAFDWSSSAADKQIRHKSYPKYDLLSLSRSPTCTIINRKDKCQSTVETVVGPKGPGRLSTPSRAGSTTGFVFRLIPPYMGTTIRATENRSNIFYGFCLPSPRWGGALVSIQLALDLQIHTRQENIASIRPEKFRRSTKRPPIMRRTKTALTALTRARRFILTK
jgi:hypothetical protein